MSQDAETLNLDMSSPTEEEDIWIPDDTDEDAEDAVAATEETTEQVEAKTEETVEAKADEKTEEAEEDKLPPLEWKPSIQPDLYTAEEQTWLERAQDDPDPKVRLQASQFMMNKSIEYNNRAALVAQAQMASIPQPFMAMHGPVVAEYLNVYVKPEMRGNPEALEQAQAWAVMQRAKQIGSAKAYREAANLLDGIQPVKIVQQQPPAPKQVATPKAPIPAENKIPSGGSNVVTDRQVRTQNRGIDRIGRALGIDMD